MQQQAAAAAAAAAQVSSPPSSSCSRRGKQQPQRMRCRHEGVDGLVASPLTLVVVSPMCAGSRTELERKEVREASADLRKAAVNYLAVPGVREALTVFFFSPLLNQSSGVLTE